MKRYLSAFVCYNTPSLLTCLFPRPTGPWCHPQRRAGRTRLAWLQQKVVFVDRGEQQMETLGEGHQWPFLQHSTSRHLLPLPLWMQTGRAIMWYVIILADCLTTFPCLCLSCVAFTSSFSTHSPPSSMPSSPPTSSPSSPPTSTPSSPVCSPLIFSAFTSASSSSTSSSATTHSSSFPSSSPPSTTVNWAR